MKRLLLLILLLSTAQAGELITTHSVFKSYVRQWTGVESTELLPDSTLIRLSALAILDVSVEVGGVEAQIRINTVAEQKMYLLPDSVVNVLATSLITTEGGTYVVRAGYPQYFDRHNQPRLGVADDATSLDDNSVPIEYHYWADTLQLLPAPIRDDDTLVLKCFIEHRASTVDSVTIDFTHPDFTTAALFLANGYVLMSLEEYDKADRWFALYEKKKASLLAQYQRKIDVPPTVEE